MLIGIAGKAGSGKTAAANYLCEKYNFEKKAFADPLKDILSILTNTPREDFEKDKESVLDFWGITKRQLMQKFGTEVMRNEYPKHIPLPCIGFETNSIWVLNFIDWYTRIHIRPGGRIISPIVVHDVRFQDEIDAIRYLGGVVIYIDRIELHLENFGQSMHSSETLSKDKVDKIIKNNGTLAELYQKIDQIFG